MIAELKNASGLISSDLSDCSMETHHQSNDQEICSIREQLFRNGEQPQPVANV